jgi:hypothetical protein
MVEFGTIVASSACGCVDTRLPVMTGRSATSGPTGTSTCKACGYSETTGGRLEVRSKAGDGTVVDLNVPVAVTYAASPDARPMSRLLAWHA